MVPHEVGRGERGRSDRVRREGPSTELVHVLQSLGGIQMDGKMYLGVGSEVEGAGSEGLCVNAPVWEGGEFITYLFPWTFHL
jgi:hypothetical protein